MPFCLLPLGGMPTAGATVRGRWLHLANGCVCDPRLERLGRQSSAVSDGSWWVMHQISRLVGDGTARGLILRPGSLHVLSGEQFARLLTVST